MLRFLEVMNDQPWQRARAAWPMFEVSSETFAAYVAERASDLNHCAEDMYLACACAAGNPVALREFERVYFQEIDLALRKMPAARAEREELRQELRVKLFVGTKERRARIADYTGKGRLRHWFRMVVTRLVLNRVSRPPAERATEEETLTMLLGPSHDLELSYLKESYRAPFRAAFARCFAELSPRERSLLWYAFDRNLSVDIIGSVYGVHRATAARWIVRAYRQWVAKVRETLRGQFGLTDTDFDSVFRSVRSQLDLSLRRPTVDVSEDG